jgi:hypothetical protein
MGRAMRHVPPAVGRAAPEPPNAWDTAVVEGPNRHKIAALLDELTEIAEVDWVFRHLKVRRDEIFVALHLLKVTSGRMTRAYAVASPPDAKGRPLFTHAGINGVLNRAGVPTERPTRPTQEEEEADE